MCSCGVIHVNACVVPLWCDIIAVELVYFITIVWCAAHLLVRCIVLCGVIKNCGQRDQPWFVGRCPHLLKTFFFCKRVVFALISLYISGARGAFESYCMSPVMTAELSRRNQKLCLVRASLTPSIYLRVFLAFFACLSSFPPPLRCVFNPSFLTCPPPFFLLLCALFFSVLPSFLCSFSHPSLPPYLPLSIAPFLPPCLPLSLTLPVPLSLPSSIPSYVWCSKIYGGGTDDGGEPLACRGPRPAGSEKGRAFCRTSSRAPGTKRNMACEAQSVCVLLGG